MNAGMTTNAVLYAAQCPPSQPPTRVHGGHPAHQVAVADALEARRPHHGGERLLVGKLADALDQVLIGRGAARYERAEARDDLEGMELVEAVEKGYLHFGELEAQEPT